MHELQLWIKCIRKIVMYFIKYMINNKELRINNNYFTTDKKHFGIIFSMLCFYNKQCCKAICDT